MTNNEINGKMNVINNIKTPLKVVDENNEKKMCYFQFLNKKGIISSSSLFHENIIKNNLLIIPQL